MTIKPNKWYALNFDTPSNPYLVNFEFDSEAQTKLWIKKNLRIENLSPIPGTKAIEWGLKRKATKKRYTKVKKYAYSDKRTTPQQRKTYRTNLRRYLRGEIAHTQIQEEHEEVLRKIRPLLEQAIHIPQDVPPVDGGGTDSSDEARPIRKKIRIKKRK